MFRLLLQKEWRLLRRNTAAWLLLAIYLPLLGWGSYNSIQHTRAVRQSLHAAQADEAERWQRIIAGVEKLKAQPDEKPLFSDVRSPSMVGGFDGPRYLLLPAGPLAALSAGEALPQQVLIATFSRHESGREEIDNPINAIAGNFDLAFVTIFLLPLTLLALTYNVISGEREAGTWALLQAMGCSARSFALVKCLWRGVIVVLPTLLAGFLACAVTASQIFDRRFLFPLCLWMLAVIGYAAFWLGLAAMVNARETSSARNTLTLVTAWVLLTMVVPGTIHGLAMQLHPPAHQFAMALEARELNVDREAKLATIYEWYYAQHPQQRPAPEAVAAANKPVPGGSRSSDSRRTYAPSVYLDEQIRPLLNQRRMQRAERQSLVQWGCLLSPALTMQMLTEMFAGADAGRFAQFEQEIDVAQERWRSFFGPKIMSLSKLAPSDYDTVPYFETPLLPAIFSLRLSSLLLLLFAFPLIAGVCAYKLLRR